MINSAFTLILCGATVGVYFAHVNRIFFYILGFISLVFIYGMLHMWLGISTIRIDRNFVKLRKGILGIGIPKQILFGDISEIKVKKVGNERESESKSFNLIMVLRNQKQITMANLIKEENHAKWLLKSIQTSIAQGQ